MFPWVLLNAVPGSLLISSIPGAFTSFEMISNNIRPQFPRSSQVRLGLDPTKICLDGWRQETTLRHRPFLESSLHPTNPIFFPKVAQSQTPVPFVRPPVVSHSARRLRWAHRGVGLCRGHRDGLLWSFDPVPDGNRFLSRFFWAIEPSLSCRWAFFIVVCSNRQVEKSAGIASCWLVVVINLYFPFSIHPWSAAIAPSFNMPWQTLALSDPWDRQDMSILAATEYDLGHFELGRALKYSK